MQNGINIVHLRKSVVALIGLISICEKVVSLISIKKKKLQKQPQHNNMIIFIELFIYE